MFCTYLSLSKWSKMMFSSFTSYRVARHTTVVSIIVLIVISVYYLNSTLEFFKKLIDHIEEANQAYARHAARNITISKMLLEPLQQSANVMYEKHEPATIMNIVSFATLIALSGCGLIVTLKKKSTFLIVYAVALDIVYSTSFLYISRLKPWICAYIVFVSIISYIHARQLIIQKSTSKISILKTTSDHELNKETTDYRYEHSSDAV